jgi:hypothetical protein
MRDGLADHLSWTSQQYGMSMLGCGKEQVNAE